MYVGPEQGSSVFAVEGAEGGQLGDEVCDALHARVVAVASHIVLQRCAGLRKRESTQRLVNAYLAALFSAAL